MRFETSSYNRFGQVETATDPTGAVTKYAYDPASSYLLSTTEGWGTAVAGTTRSTYDDVGNALVTTDPNGNRTRFAYNALNQLTKTTAPWPFNFDTFYAYDANGNLVQADRQAKDVKPGLRPSLGTSKPDDDWQSTRYGYTSLDQLAAVTDDLGQTTRFGYDPNGNRTRLTDPKQQLTQSVYDERNLLWQTLDAATPQGTTTSRYDANGNLVSLTDAKGNPTTYAYDDFDRLIRTTYADGAFEEYGYDATGNLTSRLTPAGQPITYEYDALNRLTKKITPDDTTTFTYDAAGHLLTATNATSTLTFTYDARGRVKTVTVPGGKRLTYTYDAAGNRTQLLHPDGFTVRYVYDALHRLTGLDFGGGTEPLPYPSPTPSPSPSPAPMIAFGYDALSRRTSLSLPNGLVTRYGYDAVNRLLSLVVSRGRTILLSLGSTYDTLGNRRTQTTTGGTTSYEYDPLSQLTTVTAGAATTSYRYDAAGNRATAAGQAYVPNPLNQYDAVGPTALRYDPNGNLTFDGTTTYTYDAENRLLRATRPGLSASYAYDPLGRRLSKTVNGVTTQYRYDGDQLLTEATAPGNRLLPLSSLVRLRLPLDTGLGAAAPTEPGEAAGNPRSSTSPSSTAPLIRYVYGPGLDEPLVMFKGGKRYYFHADALGSIIALTDARGQLIERYTYDAFGAPTILDPAGQVRSASTVGNRFLFTGREYDAETGLYHYRVRAYDPRLGRFLQRESQPTDLNPYRYAQNNPTSWVDPLGTNLLSPMPPPINSSDVLGAGVPSLPIDIPIANPQGLSDWTPPLANPPVGLDLIAEPVIGTEVWQKIEQGKLQPNQHPGILTASAGETSTKKKRVIRRPEGTTEIEVRGAPGTDRGESRIVRLRDKNGRTIGVWHEVRDTQGRIIHRDWKGPPNVPRPPGFKEIP